MGLIVNEHNTKRVTKQIDEDPKISSFFGEADRPR
jgi:hypothetical protein